jgi:hypothetical protein
MSLVAISPLALGTNCFMNKSYFIEMLGHLLNPPLSRKEQPLWQNNIIFKNCFQLLSRIGLVAQGAFNQHLIATVINTVEQLVNMNVTSAHLPFASWNQLFYE